MRLFILVAAALLVHLPLHANPTTPKPITIYTEDSAPTQFQNERGELDGSSIAVMRELQKRVGDTSPIRMALWANAYQEIESGKPDIILFSMARTPVRENTFKWVGPILKMTFILIARKDSDISATNIVDAKKIRTIVTVKGDYRDDYLRSLGFTNLVPVSYGAQCVKMLMNGRVDAMAVTDTGVDGIFKEAGYDPALVRRLVTIKEDGLYIAFSKGTSDQTVRRWQSAFRSMQRDGTLEAINRKWYPSAAAR